MIQFKEKLRLQAAPIMIIILLLVCSCNNDINPYKEVEFSKGLPQVLHSFEEHLPFENFSYTTLETGSDSLQVMFGTLQQGSTKGHWIAMASDGKPTSFSTVSLEEIDSLNYRSKDIDIDFNQDKNRVSVRIIELDSLAIKYSWLDDSGLSKKMILKEVKKPLRIDSQFPEITLESISGERISSSQFENQFVVINWWATSCAPCIKEIPGLNEVVDKYSNNDNVKFIAVTDDPRSRVIDFLKRKDFKYEMTFAKSEARNLFGNSYPINIIIDPSGTITYLSKGAGSNTPNEVESSLKQQLEAYNTDEIVQTN